MLTAALLPPSKTDLLANPSPLARASTPANRDTPFATLVRQQSEQRLDALRLADRQALAARVSAAAAIAIALPRPMIDHPAQRPPAPAPTPAPSPASATPVASPAAASPAAASPAGPATTTGDSSPADPNQAQAEQAAPANARAQPATPLTPRPKVAAGTVRSEGQRAADRQAASSVDASANRAARDRKLGLADGDTASGGDPASGVALALAPTLAPTLAPAPGAGLPGTAQAALSGDAAAQGDSPQPLPLPTDAGPADLAVAALAPQATVAPAGNGPVPADGLPTEAASLTAPVAQAALAAMASPAADTRPAASPAGTARPTRSDPASAAAARPSNPGAKADERALHAAKSTDRTDQPRRDLAADAAITGAAPGLAALAGLVLHPVAAGTTATGDLATAPQAPAADSSPSLLADGPAGRPPSRQAAGHSSAAGLASADALADPHASGAGLAANTGIAPGAGLATQAGAPHTPTQSFEAALQGASTQGAAKTGSANGGGREGDAVVSVTIDAPVDSPLFAPALGSQLSLLARDGVRSALLQLHPAELGPISVEIALAGNAAHIDFQALNADTRSAIEASLPALAGALQDAGLTLAGGGVFEQAPGRQPQAQADPGQAGAQAGRADAGRSSTALADTPQTPRQTAPRGLVDLIA